MIRTAYPGIVKWTWPERWARKRRIGSCSGRRRSRGFRRKCRDVAVVACRCRRRPLAFGSRRRSPVAERRTWTWPPVAQNHQDPAGNNIHSTGLGSRWYQTPPPVRCCPARFGVHRGDKATLLPGESL